MSSRLPTGAGTVALWAAGPEVLWAAGPEVLWSAEQAREADRWTIDRLGIPGIVLMEHAGRCVAERVCAHTAPTAGPVCIVVGPGNNGGDGWVAARHLWGRGYAVQVCTLREADQLSGDARLAADMFLRLLAAEGSADESAPAAALLSLHDATPLETLFRERRPALVVDALLGTGLTRPPEGLMADVIGCINTSGVPVLAVDLPSGLPSEGQAPPGACIQARETVTFGARKIAHVAEPGHRLSGSVIVADIGLHAPPGARRGHDVFCAPDLAALLPRASPGPAHTHKHRFGHVGVLQGTTATRGASRLAAYAALRAGAGLVSELVAPPLAGADAALPECMQRDALAPGACAGLGALVVGPGLGRDPDARQRARTCLLDARERDLPVVIDAEALALLAEPDLVGVRGVATPHPGEAAAWLESRSADVQRDRLGALRELARRSRHAGHRLTWVLKGTCPIVLDQHERAWLCAGEHPPLAVAGSGDVLAGAIGALLARGLDPDDAATLGVVAHQAAGERLMARGARGHLAREIADAFADAVADAAEGARGVARAPLGGIY